MNKKVILISSFFLMVFTCSAKSSVGLKASLGNDFITNWKTSNEVIDRLFSKNFSFGLGFVYSTELTDCFAFFYMQSKIKP